MAMDTTITENNFYGLLEKFISNAEFLHAEHERYENEYYKSTERNREFYSNNRGTIIKKAQEIIANMLAINKYYRLENFFADVEIDAIYGGPTDGNNVYDYYDVEKDSN